MKESFHGCFQSEHRATSGTHHIPYRQEAIGALNVDTNSEVQYTSRLVLKQHTWFLTSHKLPPYGQLGQARVDRATGSLFSLL